MPAASKRHRSSELPAGASEAKVPESPVSIDVERTLRAPVFANSEFTRFFEIEWPRLKRYLKRHVGSEEAEDVAQEAFARLYAREADAHSPSGFLYQTARNLVIDGKRREQRAKAILVESTPMDMIADSRPSPEEEVEWRQRLAQTSVLFSRMTPKCRQVFMLRVMEGCSYAEIARRLGMTSIAVEKQLLRAFEICADWSASPGAVKRRRARLS